MKKLEMTNSEIVKSYNNAEQKGIQITILAELNDTTNAHIKSILRDAGVELPRGPLPKAKKAKESGKPKPPKPYPVMKMHEGTLKEEMKEELVKFVHDAKENKPVIEIKSTTDECEGGVCELPKPGDYKPKKPMSKEVWLMARQVELKAYLADQLNAMNEVDLELVAEYNERLGERMTKNAN